MRSLTIEAGNLALAELAEDRYTVILVPDASYAAAMFDLGSTPIGIFVRFADDEDGLVTYVVDTLITIRASEMCPIHLALDKSNYLTGDQDQKWINLENEGTIILTGKQVSDTEAPQ